MQKDFYFLFFFESFKKLKIQGFYFLQKKARVLFFTNFEKLKNKHIVLLQTLKTKKASNLFFANVKKLKKKEFYLF